MLRSSTLCLPLPGERLVPSTVTIARRSASALPGRRRAEVGHDRGLEFGPRLRALPHAAGLRAAARLGAGARPVLIDVTDDVSVAAAAKVIEADAGVSNPDIFGFRHQQSHRYRRNGEYFLYGEGFPPYDEHKLTGS